MRVKMRTTYAGIHGTAQPGHVIALPDDHAHALISGGYAEAHDEQPPASEEAEPERAVIAPQEAAVAPVQRKNAAAKRVR